MRPAKLYCSSNRVFGVHCAERFVEDLFSRDPKLRKTIHSTVIRSCSARKRLSLIPRTIIKCSGLRNGPNFSRCSIIRSARPLPIPGSFSNSSAEAVLMLTRDSDLESLVDVIAVDAPDSWVAALAPRLSGLYERFTQPATSEHRTIVSVT